MCRNQGLNNHTASLGTITIIIRYRRCRDHGNCNMTETSSPAVLTHLDASGNARMVDVADKRNTLRTAIASARVRMSPQAYGLLNAQANSKGDVLNTARIAGILAAKRCAELIPLCHSLPLSFAGVDFQP